MLTLFRRDWRGTENMPQTGGFITAVNHNSVLDPLSYAHYQYNTGRVPRFLAKDTLFRSGFVGFMMRTLGQIPVYRESRDAAGAFRAAVAAVESGECVAFYPEGTLTRDPDLWPMEGKTGAARVALATRAPVVPVAQWGAHLAMPPYATERKVRLLPRKTLTVVAGPPVDLQDLHDREPTAEVLRVATDRITDAVTALLADIRGEEPPATRHAHRASGRDVPDTPRGADSADGGSGTESAGAADGHTPPHGTRETAE